MHSPLKILAAAMTICTVIYSSSLAISTAHAACTATVSGKSIAGALLARAASRHCENFPLTTSEAEQQLNDMKCNPKTKAAIEQLSPRFEGQFEELFKGPAHARFCEEAARVRASAQ